MRKLPKVRYVDLPHGSIGEQLWLWSDVPWEGVAPRALTAGYVHGILKTQGGKSMGDSVDPEQYDLWMIIKKAPWVYQGAPLL